MLKVLCLASTVVGAVDAGLRAGLSFQPMNPSLPSTLNCTWRFITQPVDHFGDSGHTFQERYCIYDSFWKKASAAGFESADEMAPIFFYTGNESPIEPYVNNTGLMWNLGAEMGALIVFAEHRFEGKSFPPINGVDDCVAFGTTAQASDTRLTLCFASSATDCPPPPPRPRGRCRRLLTTVPSSGHSSRSTMRPAHQSSLSAAATAACLLAGPASVRRRCALSSVVESSLLNLKAQRRFASAAPFSTQVFTGSIAASAPVRMIMTSDTPNYKVTEELHSE
jgi:hypothetical protein